MQYQNKRVASIARAAIQGLYALLGILTVIGFFGDEVDLLNKLKFPLLALFLFVIVVTNLGALSELDISADERYVEFSNSPVLAAKGHRVHTYSIDADKLLSFSYYPVVFFRYLVINYVGHSGKNKKVRVGLSLMSSRRRNELLDIMNSIIKKNSSTNL